MALYNSMMLSQGDSRNLYKTGFDVPEGYAIQKGQARYCAFFVAQPEGSWKGELQLRGLSPGVSYRVWDYESNRPLTGVTGPTGRLDVEPKAHLLLEAKP